MFHHDNRNYQDAVKAATEHLEKRIASSVLSAQELVERVQNEVPTDRVGPTRRFKVVYKTDEIKGVDGKGREVATYKHDIGIATNVYKESLYAPHALSQLATRADIPQRFISTLLTKPYGGELIALNFNEIFERESPEKYLFRSVDSQIRGVLSANYKRLDSRPILDAFIGACQNVGALPCEGIFGDLRFALKAIIPKVYVVGGDKSEEAVAFGIQLSHSDFGKGALSLRFFILRVWCTNTGTLQEEMRQIHLGKRLSDDIEFANDTLIADSKAQSLAVRDIVKASLGNDRVEKACALLDAAIKEEFNPTKAYAAMKEKLGLNKTEVDEVRKLYNDNGDITELPKGNNRYRMANAISWFAKAGEGVNKDRRMELERASGKLLMGDMSEEAA